MLGPNVALSSLTKRQNLVSLYIHLSFSHWRYISVIMATVHSVPRNTYVTMFLSHEIQKAPAVLLQTLVKSMGMLGLWKLAFGTDFKTWICLFLYVVFSFMYISFRNLCTFQQKGSAHEYHYNIKCDTYSIVLYRRYKQRPRDLKFTWVVTFGMQICHCVILC